MKTENPSSTKNKVAPKLATVILVVGVLLAVSCVTAHLTWKWSGSNKWELAINKGGIKVYALKTPGSTLKQYKAIMRVKTTLSQVVAAMRDESLENCADWVPGCASVTSLEPWSPQRLSSTNLYRVNPPFPLSPRELLIKGQWLQDIQSKTISIDVTAMPQMTPENECCIRIKELHNVWRFTPVENNEVEVELVEHQDPRLPYFLTNLRAAQIVYRLFSRLPVLLNKDKYRGQTFDFIQVASVN